MSGVTYVVPCFNEAARLDLAAFAAFLEACDVRLVFVDDGSTDDTAGLLSSFAAAHTGRVDFLRLERNGGKGEAVRRGMLHALTRGPEFVGFTDADLATPPSELARIAGIASRSALDVVMGSRVARAGARIERSTMRHYIGRAFATYASVLLDAGIYDTQCGAKLFRATPRLERALEHPFTSRWVFDVELLARLLFDAREPMSPEAIVEVPLDAWCDVRGSHLGLRSVPRIALDMGRAARSVAALRRALR